MKTEELNPLKIEDVIVTALHHKKLSFMIKDVAFTSCYKAIGMKYDGDMNQLVDMFKEYSNNHIYYADDIMFGEKSDYDYYMLVSQYDFIKKYRQDNPEPKDGLHVFYDNYGHTMELRSSNGVYADDVKGSPAYGNVYYDLSVSFIKNDEAYEIIDDITDFDYEYRRLVKYSNLSVVQLLEEADRINAEVSRVVKMLEDAQEATNNDKGGK